jgi:hypothetical protein
MVQAWSHMPPGDNSFSRSVELSSHETLRLEMGKCNLPYIQECILQYTAMLYIGLVSSGWLVNNIYHETFM